MRALFLSLALMLGLIFQGDTAHAQGGMGGNGGGTIDCPGEQLVVLDYDEAVRKGYPLLDLENMSRAKFFKLMVNRLYLGHAMRSTGFRANFFGSYGGENIFSYGSKLGSLLLDQTSIDKWPEIASWNVKDEFIEGNLRPNCKFEQAAISVGPKAYRIRKITDRLSHGQKLVLELHEFMSQQSYLGTSRLVRELIGVMLRKNMDYPTMRTAEYQFSDPMDDYVWEKHNLRVRTPEGASPYWKAKYHVDRSGLFALDARTGVPGGHTFDQCPRWVGIVPMGHGDFVMQLFNDTPEEPENYILPEIQMNLLQKTIVSEHDVHHYKRGILNPVTGEKTWDLEFEQNACVETLLKRCEQTGRNLRLKIAGKTCPYLKVSYENEFLTGGWDDKTRLFPLGTMTIVPGFVQSAFYVKRIRGYYEERRLGLTSEFEKDVQAVRNRLKW